MPENEELNAFLTGASEPAPVEPPAEPPAEAPAEPQAPPDPKPEPKPDQKPEHDDDAAEPPEALDGEPIVPRRAFESIRRERQDWKARAVEAETRRSELERQLEEAKQRAAAPPPQPQTYQPIDPVQDPQGYQSRIQGMLLNERLNISEMQLRKTIGAEAVDRLIEDFKAEAQADPSLYQQLYSKVDPYDWVAQQIEALRLRREVTADPAGFRAKMRAELEAEIRAGGLSNGMAANGTQPPPSRVAGMQPSLANVRSVAGRTAPSFSGPPEMSEILAGVRRHSN